MANRFRVWAPAVAWASVLFLLSSLPALGGGLPIDDKLAHGILYAVFGVTLGMGWSRAPSPVRHGILLAVGALYGVSDEWHQMYVPGRTPDLADWLADVCGLVVGYGTTVKLLGRNNVRDVDIEESR